MLPVLAVPFITLMFWALGGGTIETTAAKEGKGLNMDLPDAYLEEDRLLDKLGHYEKAASDSASIKKRRKEDPYYHPETLLDLEHLAMISSRVTGLAHEDKDYTAGHTSPLDDPHAAKVYDKLERLNEVLNRPVEAQEKMATVSFSPAPTRDAGIKGSDIDRLEQMMETMGQGDGEDPELQQLDKMLEKILDIQHPGRVQEKLRQVSKARRGQVFAVSLNSGKDLVSLLGHYESLSADRDTGDLMVNAGFYSIIGPSLKEERPNAIEAVVHETQVLTSGSTVKFRLGSDLFIDGVLVPKGNFLFGTAALNGERLIINIRSIRYGNSLFPVDLSVYDMDGLKGIYVPGSITRDAAKQSADRAVQSLGLTALDPSFGAQAATAGIEAARGLLSKKARLVKVTVKAGYKVLLSDEGRRTNN